MPMYDYKCGTCGTTIEIDILMSKVKPTLRRKCSKCKATKSFERDWSKGSAALHFLYSPMHPRHGRGRG